MKQSSQAISVRVKHLPDGKYSGQRQHDLRLGRQPNYVDPGRSPGNRILVEPPLPARMRKITLHRRNQGPPQRALRSDSAIATTAIITFGKGVQPLVSGAAIEQQDAAYRAVADAICNRYDVELRGLVVHADEAAPHAHAVFDCRSGDGRAVSKQLRGGELQDLAAAAIRPHFPEVTRGLRRAVRKEADEPKSKWVNRSVRQLHQDLPAEIAAEEAALKTIRADCDIAREDLTGAQGELEATRQRLDEAERQERALAVRLRNAEAAAEEAEARIPAAEEALQTALGRVAETEGRVRKLEDKLTELTEKEVKRLATYQKRLADRQREVQQAEKTLAGLQAQMNTAEAELTRTQAEQDQLEPVLKQTRASLAAARQELTALTDQPLSNVRLLTGRRQKEQEIKNRAVERAALAGEAYERQRQALEDQFAEKTAALDEEAARRESGITRRAQDLDHRERALETAVTAIAEDRALPAENENRWQVKDRAWWDSGGKEKLYPGPGGWGLSLWAGLRRYAEALTGGIVQQLRQQVTTLTAALTGKDTVEKQLETVQAELAKAQQERDARLTPEQADELRQTSAQRLLVLGAVGEYPKVIEDAIIEEGAELNRQLDYGRGWTALHAAVDGKKPEAVRQLLKAGADPATRDAGGATPADLARFKAERANPADRQQFEQIIQLLDPPEPEPYYSNDFSM